MGALIRFGLIVHAICALALAGSAVHLAIVCLAHATGWPPRWRAFRFAGLYGRLTGALFVGCVVIGAFIYPRYRYEVRGLYLDRYAPWASNLFDMKEILAALALPLAVTIFVLGGRLCATSSREARILFYGSSTVVVAVSLFDVISGFVIASVRSFG